MSTGLKILEILELPWNFICLGICPRNPRKTPFLANVLEFYKFCDGEEWGEQHPPPSPLTPTASYLNPSGLRYSLCFHTHLLCKAYWSWDFIHLSQKCPGILIWNSGGHPGIRQVIAGSGLDALVSQTTHIVKIFELTNRGMLQQWNPSWTFCGMSIMLQKRNVEMSWNGYIGRIGRRFLLPN